MIHRSSPLRVAIFSQDGFPRYGVGWALAPDTLASDLKQMGIEAELLGVEALADPARFSTDKFAVLVMLYGNNHPDAAFANTIAFHKSGGSLITTGIPYTHAIARKQNEWSDLGHKDDPARFGPGAIGVGGFAGPASNPGPQRVAANDPWKLKGFVTEPDKPSPAPQWLDPATVPAGVELIPTIGTAREPIAAMLVHKSGPFAGAVDAWTYRMEAGERESYDTRQLLNRAIVGVLAKRSMLSAAQTRKAYSYLGKLPKPKVYANLTLPTVKRGYDTFQPKMPKPARNLIVADIRRLSKEEKALLFTLQGLVNRTQPRIYFLTDDDDQFWLEELKRQGEIAGWTMESNPWSLLTTFKSAYKGAVICDPKIYVSPCVAASLCGADDLLLAWDAGLASRHNLPIKVDLRGKFKSNAEALRFLRTQVAPKLDPYLTCTLDPKVFDKGALDQLVAAKASVFWISGPYAQGQPGATMEAERAELREFLAKMPFGAIVRGFWWNGDGQGFQEEDGVALGSRFGKPTLVSDLITNLSVHSGVPTSALKQKPRPAPPMLDRSKVYVCFTMSDGDNLCTWRGYFRRYFNDPVRGSFPLGWGMGPGLVDLAPTWARWYYENATPNDEFLCDVSGAAYIYPPSWGTALKDRHAALRWFYDQTQSAMNRMDMNTLRLMNVRTEDIAEVGKLLPEIKYLMPDYGHAGPERYPELTYTLPGGQTVYRAATNGSGPENLAGQIRKRAGQNRPAFLNAFIWNWGSNLGDLKKTLEILGPEFVAVTPSQLDALHRQARGS